MKTEYCSCCLNVADDYLVAPCASENAFSVVAFAVAFAVVFAVVASAVDETSAIVAFAVAFAATDFPDSVKQDIVVFENA